LYLRFDGVGVGELLKPPQRFQPAGLNPRRSGLEGLYPEVAVKLNIALQFAIYFSGRVL
jgi:hypothetical protein